MNKKIIISTLIALGSVLMIGGATALLINKDNTSTNNNETKITKPVVKKLEGNELIQSVLDDVKAKTSTVTAIRVFTEDTDDNNSLGKPHEYQYAGAFYDTRTEPTEATTDNYSTSAGGSIEIYANEQDAKARGEVLANFQTGIIQVGAYRVIGANVLRASENYTASQQTEILDIMESAIK